MGAMRHLARGLGRLLRPGRAEQDVRDEVAHYMEQAGGGHRTQMEEELRSFGWENVVSTTLADLRFAARQLRSRPVFAVVAVVTLALGIGASTAIFSVANPLLFESLPYPAARQLVMITGVGRNGAQSAIAFGTFNELSSRAHDFGAMAAVDNWSPSLEGLSEPVQLTGERVTAGFFRTLGVGPLAGRDFEAAEDVPGGPRVVIVSARLAGLLSHDSAVVGRAIELNGFLWTVVGVMPPGFENVIGPGVDVWAPRQFNRSASFQSVEWGNHMRLLGRLRDGVSLDDARAEIATIARTPFAAFPRAPWCDLSTGMYVHRLQEDLTVGIRPALLAMIGAVLLVLAIACVNVTNLLLARAGQRREEFAMRVALGAGSSRLVRQLVTESLVLAALGGILGLAVARVAVGALVALVPSGLPRMAALHVDWTAFLFAMALTTLAGVLVGLAPALASARHAPQQAIQGGTRRNTGRHSVASGALVIAEVALAVVLLVGAGLLVRSLQRLLGTAAGFDAEHVVTMQVQATGQGFGSDTSLARFYDGVLDAVRAVPGVADAAFTSQLPLSGDYDRYGYQVRSQDNSENPEGDGSAFRYLVTPAYFRAMGIPLLRGRLLGDQDRPGAPRSVVVSESFANQFFKGRDPIGQQVRYGPQMQSGDWDVIIGVVGDVKQSSLAINDADAFYVAPLQWPWVDNQQTLVVRTTGDAASLAPSLRRAIWSVERVPVIRVATLSAVVAASERRRHFAMVVFEIFAVVALILAAAGIYGVLAGQVTERTREIGVRAALGASRGSILGLIFTRGMGLALGGAAIGIVIAMAASQALESLLYGISRLDPATYLGVIAVLVAVAAAACLVPAWRAARVDPCITLRAE